MCMQTDNKKGNVQGLHNICYACFCLISEKEKTLTCLQLQVRLSRSKGGTTSLSVVCRGKFSLSESHVRLNTDFRTTKILLSEFHHFELGQVYSMKDFSPLETARECSVMLCRELGWNGVASHQLSGEIINISFYRKKPQRHFHKLNFPTPSARN